MKKVLELRKNMLENLEKKQDDTKYIIYVSSESIGYSDAVHFYDVLRKIGTYKRIYLIIGSLGGDPDAAYKIVSLLRHYCDELIAIVPFLAKSAATLITLGADEIQMGPISELGPIDPQIRYSKDNGYGPAQSVNDCVEFVADKIKNADDPELLHMLLYPIIDKLDPLIIGQLERSVKAAKQYALSLLTSGMLNDDEEKARDIVQQLSEGYYSHGYVIDRIEARDMGLSVKFIDDNYWDIIWQLYYTYHLEMVNAVADEEIFRVVETTETLQKEIEDMELEDFIDSLDIDDDIDDMDDLDMEDLSEEDDE